jgi:hypothetical protein
LEEEELDDRFARELAFIKSVVLVVLSVKLLVFELAIELLFEPELPEQLLSAVELAVLLLIIIAD